MNPYKYLRITVAHERRLLFGKLEHSSQLSASANLPLILQCITRVTARYRRNELEPNRRGIRGAYGDTMVDISPLVSRRSASLRLQGGSMENPEIKQFGRYEVVAELGRGAMGVVYKARDPQIDRLVAVKTVSMWGQEPEEETEFRLRFMNEAQAAGRLHHAGIVSIFDAGENPENHDPYIVLEYVAGRVAEPDSGAREKTSAGQGACNLPKRLPRLWTMLMPRA